MSVGDDSRQPFAGPAALWLLPADLRDPALDLDTGSVGRYLALSSDIFIGLADSPPVGGERTPAPAWDPREKARPLLNLYRELIKERQAPCVL